MPETIREPELPSTEPAAPETTEPAIEAKPSTQSDDWKVKRQQKNSERLNTGAR